MNATHAAPVAWADLSAYGIEMVTAILPDGSRRVVLRPHPTVPAEPPLAPGEDVVERIGRKAVRIGFECDASGVWSRPLVKGICNKISAHLAEARIAQVDPVSFTVHVGALADAMLPPAPAAGPSEAADVDAEPAPVRAPVLVMRTVQVEDMVAAAALHGAAIGPETARHLIDSLGREALDAVERGAVEARPASATDLADELRRRLAAAVECAHMVEEVRLLSLLSPPRSDKAA